MDKVDVENRHQYFVRRLKEMGLYDDDADYDGEIAPVVERMSEAFSTYGHSGGSAHVTMGVFNQLMNEWEGNLPKTPKMPRTEE